MKSLPSYEQLESHMMKGCVMTRSGKILNVLNPDPDIIDINHIVHALTFHCNRWLGLCEGFYPVVVHLVKAFSRGETITTCPREQMCLLMHDAAEAYMCDIPSYVKEALGSYKVVEDIMMKAIAKKFNFDWPMAPHLKAIDYELRKEEYEEIIRWRVVPEFCQEFYHTKFLMIFEQLQQRIEEEKGIVL